jgi:surfactin synthase thioesterase subunit
VRCQAAEIDELSADERWERMRRLGGIPPGLDDNATLRRLIEPRMRADVALAASWRPSEPPWLGTRLLTVCGTEDGFVTAELMAGWQDCTTADRFAATNRPGGHFYRDGLADLQAPVLDFDASPGRDGVMATAEEGR